MKGKTKRFLSLLTAGVLTITSVPSAFAEETALSTKTAESITVEYSGGEKYIGSFIPADELDVIVHYSDGTTESKGGNAIVHNVTANMSAPMVLVPGWNEYTVTYNDDSADIHLTGDFKAWGYKEDGIDATYNGEAVLLNSTVDSSKISVKLMYTPHSDGSEFSEPLTNDKYVLPDLTASNFGANSFTVTSTKTEKGNTFTDNVEVYTYKEEVIATYTGENVKVGDAVDKNDITVIKKTTYSKDNSFTEESIINFTVSPSTITNVGANEITITTDIGSTTVNVTGYEEAPVVIERITAEYTGNDVRVDVSDPILRYIPADKVNITVHYSDGTTQNVGSNVIVSGVTNGDAPEVKENGWNTFTATYQEGNDSWSNTFRVWGYSIDRIEATYGGLDIRTQENYDKTDVSVVAYWTGRKDGTPVYFTPTSFEVNSLLVTKVGDNEFTATAEGKTDNFTVIGFDDRLYVDHIKATYTGDDVLVGDDYDKDKINVVYVYTNNTESEPIDDFEVNSTRITKNGENEFTVSVDNETAKIKIWGYSVDRIEATYDGPDIRTQENYDKTNVFVKAYWTERKDGTPVFFTPTSFEVNSLLVTKVGDNEFTATAEGKTDNFTVIGFDDRLYVDHIEATYTGDDVLVGDDYDKDKINVVYVYTNNTKSEPIEDFEVNSTEITKNGENEFTVSVDNETAKIKVWGYSPESVDAVYDGDNVLVGNSYSKTDLSVTLTYSVGSDGQKDKKVLTSSEYTVVDSGSNNSAEIKSKGNNTFTVTTEDGLIDTFQVWGYDVDRIVAVYNGEQIRINEAYSKNDVTVTAYYSTRTDNKETSFVVSNNDFTVDSLIITQEGTNTFNANYKNHTDDFTVIGFDDNVYVDRIEAKYIGPDILVGKSFHADDVVITIHYTDRTSRELTEGFTINPFEAGIGPVVKVRGWNEFTVTYQDKSDDIQVWGYEPKEIQAEYKGEDVLIGNEFDPNLVEVKLIYTPHSDSTVDELILSKEQYTLPSDIEVKNVEWNDYTVTYKDFTDDIQVWGYKPIAIDATYEGDNIFVGNTIKANDIKVKLIYTPSSNNKIKEEILNIADCDVKAGVTTSGLKTWKIGNNEFTVSYNNLYDTINVWGYEYDHIAADYTGTDIRTQEDYNKSDVKVTVYYTQRTDNKETSFVANKDDFEVNSTKILVVGANPYIATFETLTDDFIVTGFDDRVYIDHIEAEYVGPDILVGKSFHADDVVITIHYTDGTSRLLEEGFEINPFETGIGPVVEVRGWNEFIVTYQDKSDDIQVWGYEPKEIQAEYKGEDVLLNNPYDEKDVEVILVYSPFHDGTFKTEELSPEQYVLVDENDADNKIVSKLEWNTYTAKYKDFTDDVQVWGYKLDKLEAVYNGKAIYVDNNYDKKDVTVIATFTPSSNGSTKVIKVDKFEVNSLLVTKVGTNTYEATCEYGKAPFTVTGIEKDTSKTDNMFNIIALDRDGKEIKGVKVKFSTNGVSGTLTTGETTSAKLGIGTIITVEDCNITVPDGYKLHTSTMGTATTNTNTTYTLTIVLDKVDDDNNDDTKETVNMIKLVAVDKDGKTVNDVVLSYEKDGYSGHLKSGATTTHYLGIKTVITEKDYKLGIPNGYTFKGAKLTEEKGDTNVTYVITVTLDKNADTTKPSNNQTNNNQNSGTKTPQTGDEANAMLYMGIGGTALVSMLGLLVTKKKEEDETT